jgi:hypothetical protein
MSEANQVKCLVGSISARRAKSLLRAEDVARELRHQLSSSRTTDELDISRLIYLLSRWMRVAGNVKYVRPNSEISGDSPEN